MQTVNDIIKEFRNKLSPGYEKGELEQIMFLAFEHVCGFSKVDLALKREEPLVDERSEKLRSIIQRLMKQEPIQYIIGSTEFYGLPIKVNKHVLIPRQETEELVDLIIKDSAIHPSSKEINILDVCTGSGCIAIALKKNITNSTVSGVDISENALKIAEENSELNGTTVSFVKADIFQIKALDELFSNRFDIIVSNPPYVLESEKELMKECVLLYEPDIALFVRNDDPLIFYRHIADMAIHGLNPGGKLYFEINEQKGKEVCEMLAAKGFKDVTLRQDLNGKARMVSCRYDIIEHG